MNTSVRRWVLLAVLVAIAAGGYLWWRATGPEQPAPPEPPRAEASPSSESPAPPPEPQIRHPIEEARPQPEREPARPEAEKSIEDLLIGLLGAESVRRFLDVDDFVRRVVSTVDNLPRRRAPLRLWPIRPTPGRLLVTGRGDEVSLSPENASRYAPFVRFVERIDTDKAVALYVRLYPRFQRAYEELGYPKRYFNDRLVEVIEHLLATPEPSGPIRLIAPEPKGPLAQAVPRVLYDYADPELEALSAGQKILLRMGAENAARLKTKLRQVRARVASGAPK